jgi:hypothetical protein
LPPEVRATLDRWYAERDIYQPPPCAIPGYIIRPVFTSDAVRFARYEHEDGEQLEAMLYTLPELAPRFEEGSIVVVQGPTKGPFVIITANSTSPLYSSPLLFTLLGSPLSALAFPFETYLVPC